MGIAQALRLAWLKSQLETRNRWNRPKLIEHQARQLEALRRHAYAYSRFYRDFHSGLMEQPLEELPVLTKMMVMEHFDELVTDRTIRLRGVEDHLADAGPDDRYLGRYTVSASSGSTGVRGFFLFDTSEWGILLASYLRPSWWAGAAPTVTRRWKGARFTSQVPWHAGAQVAASLKSPIVSFLSFDPTRPVEPAIGQLNEWQPNVLGGYASVLRALAEQQLAGRLQIRPQFVPTGGEVLTQEARARIEAAWGRVLFNAYATSECGVLAAECREHAGLHLFEDLTIFEIVDSEGRPVPPGRLGERVLATVLFRGTQPLIRYEISDCVRLADHTCPCGRPFRLIDAVEGRKEDILYFPSSDGRPVPIDPLVFEAVLDTVPASQWQVVQEQGSLDVLLVGLAPEFDKRRITEPISRELLSRGVSGPAIRILSVAAIPRGATGKAALIRSNIKHASEQSGGCKSPVS